MSLVTDSPVNSSSSDDFAAFLDGHLETKSSDDADEKDDGEVKNSFASSSSASSSSEDESEDEEDYQPISKRTKISEVEEIIENGDSQEGSTSRVIVEQKSGTFMVVKLTNMWFCSLIWYSAEASSSSTISKKVCAHRGSFAKMCIDCGQQLEEESGVTFKYIHKELWLGNDEVERLRDIDTKSLLRHKKLYLILDLDHTLLNSTLLGHMVPEEEYLNDRLDSIQARNGSLFRLTTMRMMTKLRPYVHSFLKDASKMFDMYIYTMGDKAYALEMANLLDPGKEYFNAKVISRDDGTQRHQKGLDVVLGDERAVLILDDTENVWPSHKDNLIVMERYHFFASSCRQFGFECKSLSQHKSDESEPEGALATVLKVLQRVHHIFFHELADQADRRDVRQILKSVRKDVLKGCRIVFSRVFPTQFPAESHHLWKMAVNLGATCTIEVDPSVTHVVAMDPGTKKSRWALENDKFLVLPRWIEAANYHWRRVPEENYSVSQQPKSVDQPSKET
ncbi:RNA polymerase II C-terminal domain phosphatase-like 4 [Linum perenne]